MCSILPGAIQHSTASAVQCSIAATVQLGCCADVPTVRAPDPSDRMWYSTLEFWIKERVLEEGIYYSTVYGEEVIDYS